jgi:enoyl-CoA hydratase/carnithine racemase
VTVPERAYTKILVTQDGGALRIALHNPARKNAIGPVMVNELLWALDDAHAAADVRVVVITGSGDAFCAGGDFAQMSGQEGAADALAHKGDYADLLLAMTRAQKPIVARVNGAAMGGGLGIVAASHFAIADVEAKLGTPEVDVGLFPMMIMAVLARIVPQRKLIAMMLLGEKLKGAEAAAIGLVGKAVAKEELDAEVERIVLALAAKSPAALRLGLEAWADQADASLADALPMLRERLGRILGTDDAREGLTAFLEKRAPRWTGK